ncbi:hypothetical protein C343_05773 [Cryptococcus neoformans C23]|nr:hypothetical protein C343_05773 [Cryptococcus neoformans var. grubii C23]
MPAAAPIILGTMAVIGTGYIFKKLVYDSHLAPYIESAWETSRSRAEAVADMVRVPSVHHFHRHRRGHRYERVEDEEENEEVEGKAIAMPVIGTSTAILSPGGGAWRGEGKNLRRRGSKRAGSEEFESEFKPTNPLFELPPSSSTSPSSTMIEKPSKTSKAPTPVTAAVATSAAKGWQTPDYTVTRPDSAQDAEVRSIIFNIPSTFPPPPPSRSAPHSWSNNSIPMRLSSPTSAVGASSPNEEGDIFASPPFSPVTGPGFVPAPSTTFSFLSLSQQSSPAYIPQALNEFTFDRVDRRSEEAAHGSACSPRMNREGGGAREDDVISLAETSTTGFEDAEAYSPTPLSRTLSGSSASPRSQAGNLFHMPNNAGGDAFIDTLGLTYVMPTLSSHAHASGPSSYPYPQKRGPMSVVSVSGSEADEGRTDSEWEAVGSEYGR